MNTGESHRTTGTLEALFFLLLIQLINKRFHGLLLKRSEMLKQLSIMQLQIFLCFEQKFSFDDY